jgi:hypothetical protein
VEKISGKNMHGCFNDFQLLGCVTGIIVTGVIDAEQFFIDANPSPIKLTGQSALP